MDRRSILIFIQELRKSLRAILIALPILSVTIFLLSSRLLAFFQGRLTGKLYFFSVAEPFLAHAKLSLAAACLVLAPWLLFVLLRAAAKPFKTSRLFVATMVVATTLLFYAGAVFCFFVTLPFGIKFLLGFSSAELQPVISIDKFVQFVILFILGFGLVFELPVAMVFLGKIGICGRKFFQRHRRWAILLITIAAAVLTPSPDALNMALMGVPIYLLYECGIIIMILLRIP
ncbi:MAG: twin-arginine translocase subunit TatC [Desulfobulbaceae bacterium]|jgi:sec-independent protein translocase protein TatC|nr:twin-arginine translocase subunit TatC [Desulfobulbaceae bacterium]